MNALRRYVSFWDQREAAWSLALVRSFVGAVLLSDLVQLGWLDLVVALWGPVEEGGIGPASHARPVATLYGWIGASTGSAFLLTGVATLAAAAVCVGFWTRLSAVVLAFCSAQFSDLSPGADRGIDALLRNALIVLAFSGAGATWSLDAWRKTGRFAPEATIQAWPRYLVIGQLVLLYFLAGIYKQSASWSSIGGYSALFVVLHKPHFVRFEVPHDVLVAIYPLLQLSTVSTLAFECSAPLLPFAIWLRRRSRVLRSFLIAWIATGVVFHLALALFFALGIFPWGCLALYPALLDPESVRRLSLRLALPWQRRRRPLSG